VGLRVTLLSPAGIRLRPLLARKKAWRAADRPVTGGTGRRGGSSRSGGRTGDDGAVFLGAGWWVQADRATVRPFVVEVSDWGQTQRITALDGRYEPTEAQVGHALAGWVRNVRAKSVDPVVIRQNWLAAYDLVTPKAGSFLNAWAQAHDPFAEVGREAVNVEVLNVVRRSDRTYDLQWRETRFVNGQQAGQQRWRALITIKLQPPKTEAELLKNPLGIRIEDVSWTPDAS